jgi:hypothetical protein
VYRLAVQLGGEFDSADWFDAGLASQRSCLVEAPEGVVIRDSEHAYSGPDGFVH